MPEQSILFWAIAVFVVFLLGLGKTGFGGGIGVVATPLLALVMPVASAAALLLPVLLVMDIYAFSRFHEHVDRKNMLVLLPAEIVGVVFGALFFSAFVDDERLLRTSLGVLGISFLLYQFGRNQLFGRLEGKALPLPINIVLGTLAGFGSMIAHVGGPPAMVVLLPQKLPRSTFVSTFLAYFLVLNLIKLVPYAYLGLLSVGDITTVLLLLPAALLGGYAGLRLHHAINEQVFTGIIYFLLAVTSVQLISGRNWLSLFMS